MKSKHLFLSALFIIFLLTNNVFAQVNTRNANGSYNPNGYKQWRDSEELKRNQKSFDDALEKNKSIAPVKKRSSSDLYEPTQSAEDIKRNNTCLSGNCKTGFGTWQGTPNTLYKYIGEFKNGEIQGKGKLYDWEGYLLFDGVIENGKKTGRTINYKQEKAFGDGSISYYNVSLQNVYDGTLVGGSKEGFGVFSEYDKDEKLKTVYRGNFKENKRDEKGTLIQYYGKQVVDEFYIGVWKDGKREGQGVDSAFRGRYVGEFKNDMRNGEGVAFWRDGLADTLTVEYVGQWKDGKKDGIGTDYDKTGKMVYEGGFKNDKRNGAGKFYAADNKVSNGTWVDGVNAEIDPSSVPKVAFALKEINENFNNSNANQWITDSFQELKKGSYTLRGITKKTAIPGNISFKATDDWTYEASMKKVKGVISATWGIGWDNAQFMLHELGFAYFNYNKILGTRPAGADCKVKKGSNTIKVVKKGATIEAFVNGNNIYTGPADGITSKNLYLILEGKDSASDKFLVEYTGVIFKLQ